MKFPKLRTLPTARQMVDVFKGYNRSPRIGDGEFSDMRNMTSDLFPVLAPRKQRGLYAQPQALGGIIAKDSLCYVDGKNFVINEKSIDMGLNDQPKQLVSMGAYVIILPDKKYINTQNLSDHGNIEAFFPAEKGQEIVATYEMCKADGTIYEHVFKSTVAPEDPENMQLWIDQSTTPHVLKQYSKNSGVWVSVATTYIKISATNIAQNFSQYDAVKITGFPQKSAQLSQMNDVTYPLWGAYHDPGDVKLSREEGTDDYIIIVGLLDEAGTYTSDLRLERTMPVMDFVIESDNRLWGCHYGIAANGQMVNEIYCSKLGDFKNWDCRMGISTDSWTGGCGTDGPFTGAIAHLGYPLFFKENYLHKIYGNFPSNFQIQTTACRGVQRGSEKSLAIVNELLLYKAAHGICAYDGSLPAQVSYALGDAPYTNAVGGAYGNKYYVSMDDSAEVSHLFVYDTAKGLWYREDNLRADQFCPCREELYAISGGKIITLFGSGEKDTAPVQWMVQTGELGLSSPDMKYISRLILRLAMDLGTRVRIYGQYDFSPAWEHLGSIQSDSLRSFSLPIRPKRCDHMRLRIEGEGPVRIYSLTKIMEQGSDLS